MAPLLYCKLMVSLNGPKPVGANSIAIVHVVPAPANVTPQVPPVPGYVPPRKANGAANPISVIALAVTAPLLVIVNTLESVPPLAINP